MPKSSKGKNETRRANRDRRQRLEELRRQQRASERRKNMMFATAAVIVGVALIAGAVIPTYLHDRAQKAKQKPGYQAKPTALEKSAGCLGLHNDPVSPAAQHFTTPIDYSKEKYGDTRGGTPPIPPSGGKHNPVSLGQTLRYYPLSASPRPERAVHNLEHGFVVAWFDSKLPQADVTTLQQLSQTLPRFLAVGWYQGDLPDGKHLVLTSWGRTDRCSSANANMIRAFYSKHVDSSLAPEKGLPAIQGADSYLPSQLPAKGVKPGAVSPTPSPTPSKKK